MTRTLTIGLALTAYLLSSMVHATNPQESCTVTSGTDQAPGTPLGDASSWYGSEFLAALLPPEGKLRLAGPDARIDFKLFLWSPGFEPGMERHLSIVIESVTDEEAKAVVDKISHAKPIDGGFWAMLAGIEFPGPGCWQITAKYREQSLAFVVETFQ